MKSLFTLIAALLISNCVLALDPDLQAKVDARLSEVKGWGSDAVIVGATKGHSSALSDQVKAMTNDKWKVTSHFDPFVKELARNEAAKWLKAKGGAVSEAFVNGVDGTKVAFITKTTYWSHKGKPKHDVPMSGKTWQGEVEVDESTGIKQIQIGVPVLDAGKVIGSLVVGFDVSKL